MAGRVYSVRFDLIPDTPIVAHYNVPPGFIGVVRDMRFHLPSAGDWGVNPVCEVYTDDTANVIWQIKRRDPAPGVYSWQGRQVFNTTLQWTHYSTTATLVASGYLLAVP